MNKNKSFQENMKNIRTYRKLTQEDLGEKLHMSKSMVHKLECGEMTPSMTLVRDIAKALMVEPKELFI